ncbi:MAG: sigma-70 family RNA polymerase sigma factor [Victivallales bacterium]|nr:sigma-70 family RNA polymerase sigma factor [Victivallales bacterium]
MPAESSHPKLSPQPRRNAIRMHNDGWMNSAWNNFELNPTYMQEVGTFELLNADEEVRYAKEYSEARAKIHGLLAQFPQVIMAELDFLRNLPPGQLLSFIELDPCNDDLVYSDDALEKLIAQAIEMLLDKRKEILRQFARFQPSKSRNATEHAVQVTGEWLPQIFNPIVKEFGKLSFQPRFYSACVEFFIRGEWEATGLDEAQRHALSTQMEEIHQRAIKAMNNLVEGNLRLVISIARHFVCTLMPLSDLVQEGNIGLMRAVESFEYQRGHRFSTYASYWIRQSITHALNVNGRSIRIPVNIVRQLSKIHRMEREFLQEQGRPPSIEELASLVGLSVPRIRALLKMGQQPLSLQAIATEDRDWNDILADEQSLTHQTDSGHDITKSVLEVLEPREREILMRRFGLLGHSVETLEQVAKHFGLTGERIRQLEAIALRKLRKPESNSLLDNIEK